MTNKISVLTFYVCIHVCIFICVSRWLIGCISWLSDVKYDDKTPGMFEVGSPMETRY